ncbi:hypothetical protein [Pseudoalteromonas shioyasakiensis]|uniref:hypothetical protein n=1 Tax=Pseudoalteromonas shioyasakiensis TaxID=1190813 RepID=UPI001C3CE064|nr:hypothetical protein [Pseudoalteromonas shioyasakiensis]
MKRFNKIALIPAAIAAGLASNAYAGTEACFEIYKSATVANHENLFTGASCGTRVASPAATAGTTTQVQTIDEMSAAYELTKSLPIDFEFIDGTTTANMQQIVYIPTTDIPGGTNIVVKVDGAVFDGNSNQIHLVKSDGTTISAVASSDGTVDGSGTITFLTKAGITIGAGSRLAFSRVATSVDPVGIKIANDQCTTASASKTVTIAATNAKTDGGTGYDIIGGISKATDLVDISAQFYALNGGTTADVDVNAESSNADNTAIVARTEFVFDSDRTKQLTATKTQAIYKTAFYNRGVSGNLDRFITLGANDHLETQFVATAEPGSTVKMGLYNSRTVGTGSTDTALTDQVAVETGTTWGSFGLTKAAAPVYNTEATDVFTPATSGDAETNPATGTSNLVGADYNEMFYAVTNTSASGIMNFNYDVNTHFTLDFGNTSYNDHCAADKFTHNIDVNGAVLKVPYVVNGEGNFVRVTNEHDEAAEVTVDVFGESDNGNTGNRKVTAVKLGTVPAKSSVVYFVPELIEEAVSQKSYTGADGGYAAGSLGTDGVNAKSNANRHTLTFTVTAPRDTVHGVSVQRVLGGSDRVMPVLDQNEWSQ